MGTYHPFTEAFRNAMELRNFAEDIRFRREQREQQRKEWAQQLEDRASDRKMREFQTSMALRASGYEPLPPGVSTKADLGAAGSLEDPFGRRYSIPDERQAEKAGRLKGREEAAKLDITDPMVDVEIPPELSTRRLTIGGLGPAGEAVGSMRLKAPETRKVRSSQLTKMYELIWKSKGKDYTDITHTTDASGNVSFFGTNKNTGKVDKLYSAPGAGKAQPQKPGREEKTGLSPRATEFLERAEKMRQRAMHPGKNDTTRPEEYWEDYRKFAALGAKAFPDELVATGIDAPKALSPEAQSALNEVETLLNRAGELTYSPKAKDKDKQDAEALYQEAKSKIEEYGKKYPDELETGIGSSGFPYLKQKMSYPWLGPKEGHRQTGPAHVTGLPPTASPDVSVRRSEAAKKARGATMPAENVRAAAANLEMSDEEFSKFWQDNGGHIEKPSRKKRRGA